MYNIAKLMLNNMLISAFTIMNIIIVISHIDTFLLTESVDQQASMLDVTSHSASTCITGFRCSYIAIYIYLYIYIL